MDGVDGFMREYGLSCAAAVKRFRIGVPATTEHASKFDSGGSGLNAKHVAATVQVCLNRFAC